MLVRSLKTNALPIDYDLEVYPGKLIVRYDVHNQTWSLKNRVANVVVDPDNGTVDDQDTEQLPKTDGEFTITLEELRSRRDWHGGSLYALYLDVVNATFAGIINVNAEGLSSRRAHIGHFLPILYRPNTIAVIKIAIYSKLDDFSTCGIAVNQRQDANFTCNIEYSDKPSPQYSFQIPSVILADIKPKFEIAGSDTLKVDAKATYTLTSTQTGSPSTLPLEVYLKSNNGYIPKRKINVIDGTGEFSVMALGLEKGDVIEVKAGLRFIETMVRKQIRVI